MVDFLSQSIPLRELIYLPIKLSNDIYLIMTVLPKETVQNYLSRLNRTGCFKLNFNNHWRSATDLSFRRDKSLHLSNTYNFKT